MNRAQRRAAKRLNASFDHLDCGCQPRQLAPVEPNPSCPNCGQPSAFFDHPLVLPTAAPVGTLKQLFVSCGNFGCGTEYAILCEVLA